jgi:hypothetical protein
LSVSVVLPQAEACRPLFRGLKRPSLIYGIG